MNTIEPVMEKEFPVRYHELDCHGDIRPVALLNYMQDAAGMHAMQLGVSVADLHRLGLIWVLSRIHLVMERYPHGNDTLRLRTWPSTRQEYFSCREFELFDSRGRKAGAATTSWAVLDIGTRRPVRLEERLPAYPLLSQRAVEDNFPTLPLIGPDSAVDEHSFRVLRGDLDINRHVNNTIYAGWALESVPDTLAAARLTGLEISFRAEALYGESVISRCAVAEPGPDACCLHQIISRGDGRELARMRTRWQSTPPTSTGGNN